MQEFRYKWRPLTRRLPHAWVHRSLDLLGSALHTLKFWMDHSRATRELAFRFVPWYTMPPGGEGGTLPRARRIELEKCVTFDALTPRHDDPMTTSDFVGTLEVEGFRIEHLYDGEIGPLYATAVRAEGSRTAPGGGRGAEGPVPSGPGETRTRARRPRVQIGTATPGRSSNRCAPSSGP